MVTLITAGMVKIPFWKYLGVNLLGQFIWTGILIGIGYFFSSVYVSIDQHSIIGKMSAIVGFIVIIVLAWRFSKYLRSRADKEIMSS